ncbi:ATP-binding cassette domain-containing protein [Streptomyces sp. CA-132043]|uniref:ATP-binding cassette domain-containing protein n=1 Tax=Streptomyces sp. CA-132043 TaxID=3240048 RepID=UPI003D8C0F04
MIQAVGLTSEARRGLPPAVDDLTFEAPAGQVTVLLGARGAGKTTALRLMLRMERGRGITLFRGRPLHRLPNPARELGVLLGDVPGHPARTARSHLRMLTAAAGVPADRAEDVLEVVGLSGLAEERLGEFSRGMDRRLGMAAALLGDPHTLLLDEPDEGVSPREAAWLYGLLRGFAAQGGSVLVTASDAKAAARLGDRIVTVEDGRLLADQEAADFTHTRLRPRVSVRSPHADRLAAILVDEWQRADPAVDPRAEQALEVVRESGNRIAVYGSNCALVGDTAYRHGILVHQLADEIGDARPTIPLNRADGRPAARPATGHGAMVAAEAAKDEAEYEKSDARYAGAPHERSADEPYADAYENGRRPDGAESAEPYAEAPAETYAETRTTPAAPDEAAEANASPGEPVRKDAGGHCALISGPAVSGPGGTGKGERTGGLQGAGRRVTTSGRALSVADRASANGMANCDGNANAIGSTNANGSASGSANGSELTTTLELPVIPADGEQSPRSEESTDTPSAPSHGHGHGHSPGPGPGPGSAPASPPPVRRARPPPRAAGFSPRGWCCRGCPLRGQRGRSGTRSGGRSVTVRRWASGCSC